TRPRAVLAWQRLLDQDVENPTSGSQTTPNECWSWRIARLIYSWIHPSARRFGVATFAGSGCGKSDFRLADHTE
ncbi:hypothetical protein VS884_26070, partial [Escherichia coli]